MQLRRPTSRPSELRVASRRWVRLGRAVLVLLFVFGIGLLLGAVTRDKSVGTSLRVGAGAACFQGGPTCATSTMSASPVSASPASPVASSVASGCGGGAYPACVSSSPDQSAPPSQTVTVTQADRGRTIRLHRGDTLIVDLRGGGTWVWSAPHPGDGAVLRTDGSSTSNGDAQARFSAVGPGNTDVSSTGDPRCRQASPPCGAPSQLWRIHVEVIG